MCGIIHDRLCSLEEHVRVCEGCRWRARRRRSGRREPREIIVAGDEDRLLEKLKIRIGVRVPFFSSVVVKVAILLPKHRGKRELFGIFIESPDV
jgi:hypothetical protein